MKTQKTIFMAILAITFMLSSQLAKAQFPINNTTKKVQFTGVIELPGMPKDKIFKKAKLWLVTNLKSSDNMVDLNGNNSDLIVGAGIVYLDSLLIQKEMYAKIATLSFKFVVYIKDNKLKYSIENCFLQYTISIPLPGMLEKEATYQTGLEDLNIKSSNILYISDKNAKIFKDTNTAYLNSVIDNIIESFKSSVKENEVNEW